jgi:ABC-type Mn2+/Zn2+ transport system ATPase subunit
LSELAVELREVSVRLSGRTVLEAISLGVGRGTFLGIVGPNGAGKTTLLRVILGLLRADQGEVFVFGEPSRRARSVGYVPQRSQAEMRFPVSALDVVLMGRYGRLGLFRRPGDRDRASALHHLERVDMKEAAGTRLSELSGGEQQRVFIARALAAEPELLLLDEPAAGVDVAAERTLYELLRELKDELGLTILMVTHDIGVIPQVADEVACINRRLFIHGKAREVLTEEVLERAYGRGLELLIHPGGASHRAVRDAH